MAERVLFFTVEDDATQATWRVDGRSRTGALTELAACAADVRVWLIDGRRVQLAETELPPGHRRVQAQALPYALEDQVLSPVDELGFALHRLSATRLAATVFDLADVSARLAALEGSGVAVDRCIPDILCVPWRESAWTLLFDGDDAWLRTGPYAGARFDAAHWRVFVEQSLVGVDGERHVRVYGANESLLAEIAALSPALVIDPASRAGPVERLALLAEGHAQGHVIDLLSGLPRRRKAVDGAARRWWLATAALVVLVALAHAAFMQWRVVSLDAELREARAATETLFREMFPQITRIEDVRVQAAQALAEDEAAQRDGAPFLDLFATAGEALSQQGGDGLTFESVSYGNGAIEMRVRANDMSGLERYQQTLGSVLPVQLLSVENRDATAVGLLRVGQLR